MRRQISEAIALLYTFKLGDPVTVLQEGRTFRMTCSHEARRSDGAFGSVESTYITASFGPGRYAIDVRAEKLANGQQIIEHAPAETIS